MAAEVNIPLDSELAGLLQKYGKPLRETARDLIVLELIAKVRFPAAKPEN